jgi:CBS domain containing-hemolysin-like protein
MINRVLDLPNVTVGQVAIPMSDVVTVKTRTRMSEVMQLARDKRVSRVPVWRSEGSGQRIAGIVSLRTVLYQADLDLERTAGEYLKPALYMEEDLPLEAALRRMQRGGQRLAIVLGRDKREVGVVTLEDILKFVFGEVKF